MDTNKQIKEYEAFRAIPVDGLSQEQLSQLTQQALKEGMIKDVQKAATSFGILHKVAHNVEQEEWLDFCNSGQLPPIKLSTEEMEAVRGGALGLLSIAGICFMAGVTIYAATKD